jgi:hypothetical protein
MTKTDEVQTSMKDIFHSVCAVWNAELVEIILGKWQFTFKYGEV